MKGLFPSQPLVGLLWLGIGLSTGAPGPAAETPNTFESDLRPLLKKYCHRCHGVEKPKGDVQLETFTSAASLLANRQLWLEAVHQLRTEEMPPKKPLPTPAERLRLVQGLERILTDIDWDKIRDPGHETLPRLTKDEYNNTLRDLLGLDVRPGRIFSEDGEGASGFSNDRDSLFLTPAQMEKYFDAAGQALDALLALDLPPMETRLESEAMFMTETRETPKQLADDFLGYALNRGQMTLYDSVAFPYDGFYVFDVRAQSTAGPIGARMRLNDLPVADISLPDDVARVYSITQFVEAGTHQMAWNILKPPAPSKRSRTQPAPARTYPPLPKDADRVVDRLSPRNAPRYPASGKESGALRQLIARVDATANGVQRPFEWLRLLGPDGNPNDIVRFKGFIEERTPAFETALANLARALEESPDQVRAGFDQANAATLADRQRLLDAVRDITRQSLARSRPPGSAAIDWIHIRGPVRPAGSPDRDLVFIAKPGPDLSEDGAARRILDHFARRAFRRPVETAETARYLELYERARQRGEPFKPAVKLALSGILVSPHFVFRPEFGPGLKEAPLNDWQLASRLSYFLWLTMPDPELFRLAEAGTLNQESVLRNQVRRLLADGRSRAFTEAFLGQWLGFAELGESVFPDPEVYPEFTASLNLAMKEETYRIFERMLRENRPVLELLDSDETFLNGTLARHYGIPGITGPELRPVRLKVRERGGLLGMGSVLTATSSPRRTSPVVRGKWVLETLLGQPTPEPPPDAGELPGNAGEKAGRTLREEFEQHRRNPSCASCHEKIDPLGFGLENFDAIGRFRTRENGQPVDSRGTLPGGISFRGPVELKAYLSAARRDEFLDNLARRLLAFALGRKLELHDEPAVGKIVEATRNDDYKAGTLVAEVVLSLPFRNQNHDSGAAGAE